jgi:uncharacterized membrane protein YiaA
MSNATLDWLVWVCIYAGLFVFGLGIWFAEHHLAAGAALMLLGGVLLTAGAWLLWLRSRRS